ncbi:CD225/dispanin family protein [Nocardiopsis lucentensis]|nr:hypothetical protein [Nocardiopsis lucentensis]
MTLCCNQICGIIAIVFSVVAMGKDDWAERDRFIGHAWTTMTIGLVISLVFLVIYFLAFAGG